MSLKAILFDFNGVIINDEIIHQQLIDDLLLGENLPPSGSQYRQFCLGKGDRTCIEDILKSRGRVISEEYLNKLIQKKSETYQKIIKDMENLPIVDKVIEFILSLQSRYLPLGIVTSALRKEVESVLERINIKQYFEVMVTGEEIKKGKPSPEGYLLGIEKLCQQNPSLDLKPSHCLAIENTPAGIESAKKAGIAVVGVANTYPFHMIQRQANWCVDHLMELDLDWINQTMNNS